MKLLTYLVTDTVVLRVQSCQMRLKAVNFVKRKSAFSKAADNSKNIKRPSSCGYGYLRQRPHLLILLSDLQRIESNSTVDKIELTFGSN